MSNDFWLNYKKPEWQKFRLEVLNRAGWECSLCKDNTSELHVHHRVYFKDRKPWEYALDQVEVLCKPCHEYAEDCRISLRQAVSKIPVGRSDEVVGLLEGYVCGPGEDNRSADTFMVAVGELAKAAANQLRIEQVWDLTDVINRGGAVKPNA